MTEENDTAPVTSKPRRPARTARRIRTEPETASPENRLRKPARTANNRQARPAVREEVAREEERAPVEGRLYRQRKEANDDFFVDRRVIPQGASYEWKRETAYGARNPAYEIGLADNHWKPVPASRHPHLLPEGSNESVIRRDGMVLMERPAYLTQEARQEDYTKARDQVNGHRSKISSTPDGTLERRQASINTSYEPMMIPD